MSGKIKLSSCDIVPCDTGYPFSFQIVKTNGYKLVLRTSDEATKNQWIEAIKQHVSSSHSPVKAILPPPGLC